MFDLDDISEKQAKELIQRLVKSVGFDSFAVVDLPFDQGSTLQLFKDSEYTPHQCISTTTDIASTYWIFSFQCTSINKYSSCLRKIINEKMYVAVIDYMQVCIIHYPNEITIESMLIRLDLMEK